MTQGWSFDDFTREWRDRPSMVPIANSTRKTPRSPRKNEGGGRKLIGRNGFSEKNFRSAIGERMIRISGQQHGIARVPSSREILGPRSSPSDGSQRGPADTSRVRGSAWEMQ